MPKERSTISLKDKTLDMMKRYMSDLNQLAMDRERLSDSYLCRPFGNEVENRSQFVMSDTQDTIEWVMPHLLRVFYSGKDVVRIEGQGPEDEAGAKLLNEKVNHDFQKGFNGYLCLHDWFKDALMSKPAIVKYWWETGERYRGRSYKHLSTPEFDRLSEQVNSGTFIIDKKTETKEKSTQVSFDPLTGDLVQAPEETFFDVEGREIKKISQPMAACLPPEEFIFNTRSISLDDEDCVVHRVRIHETALMEKYDITQEELELEGQNFESNDTDYYARFKDLGGAEFYRDQSDKSYYYLYECYVNDYSEGFKNPVILTLLGNSELKREPNTYGKPPFCLLSSVRMPHRVIGRCLADLTMDIQKLKSALARMAIDNLAFQNNGMSLVNPFKVNMTDFLYNRNPGGFARMIVDEPVQNAIMQLPVQPFAGHAFEMLNRTDEWLQKRSGITSYNQGLDADSLNKTASGISQILSMSQARVEFIARTFAETGVKELFTAFAEMNVMFLKESTAIRLNEQWMPIDPDMIDVDYDISIEVGLGSGQQQQLLQQLMGILQTLLAPPVLQSGVFTPKNLYAVLSTIFEKMGFKQVATFLTEPPEMPPQGDPNAAPVQGAVPPPPGGPPAGNQPVGGGPGPPQ